MASGAVAVLPAECFDSKKLILARTFRVRARMALVCVSLTSTLSCSTALCFLAVPMAVERNGSCCREQVGSCRADALLRRAGRSEIGSGASSLRAGDMRRAWALSSAAYKVFGALRQIIDFLCRSRAEHSTAVRLEWLEGNAIGDTRGREIAPNKLVRGEIETCFGRMMARPGS